MNNCSEEGTLHIMCTNKIQNTFYEKIYEGSAHTKIRITMKSNDGRN